MVLIRKREYQISSEDLSRSPRLLQKQAETEDVPRQLTHQILHNTLTTAASETFKIGGVPIPKAVLSVCLAHLNGSLSQRLSEFAIAPQSS